MGQRARKVWRFVKRPPLRTLLLLLGVLGALGVAYLVWSPGLRVRDGRHDLRSNGIWVQHGWLGDDGWFARNERDASLFRDPKRIRQLARLLADHGVMYVFLHLCPCGPGGAVAPVDAEQTERFLDAFADFRVLPWIGGVRGRQCSPESPTWRATFVASVVELLRAHPRLAGVHVNIEPLPSGDPDFLTLLDELRQALPSGKLLSVAAYPPPTRWQPSPEVHWDESYLRQVARRVDQLAVMMYDTGIRWRKPYRHLMSQWTAEVLDWSGDTQVLLGLPAYDDAGVGYHHPDVENLENSLLGVHAGLSRFDTLPAHYRGVALYCEWEMDEREWRYFKAEFERSP